MDIQVEIDPRKIQSSSHHPIRQQKVPPEMQGHLGQKMQFEKILEDLHQEQFEDVVSEEMYQVFDIEEGKYMDIRDLEKDIYVTDSVSYFDKRQAL
jgi:hypothetical protein